MRNNAFILKEVHKVLCDASPQSAEEMRPRGFAFVELASFEYPRGV